MRSFWSGSGVAEGHEAKRANAEPIHERLAAGSMSCDGRWPDEQVERFRTWIEQGAKP